VIYKIRILVIFLFSLFLSTGFAQVKKQPVKGKKTKPVIFNADSLKGCVLCLKINGKADVGKNKNDVSVKIFRYDSLVQTVESDKNSGKFKFYLPFQNEFKIVLTKPGYYDKFITIDTKFPNKKITSAYELEFSTQMFRVLKSLDASILKKPIAEIKFDARGDNFWFDPQYTESIKEDINRLYNDYIFLEKVESDLSDSTGSSKKHPR